MAETSAQVARRKRIRGFIVESIVAHPKDIIGYTASHFKTSRQAVGQHLNQMVEEGLISAKGKTRSRTYTPVTLGETRLELDLSRQIAEDEIWRESVRPMLIRITDQALTISEYAFTEMLNNAIDHSEGKRVDVLATYNVAQVELVVRDDGVGIFAKIKKELGLEDERHSMLELAKGKFTTDPARHSGEGIFFTSRAVDTFSLVSGKLLFGHAREGGDWLLDDLSDLPPSLQQVHGTFVGMIINPNSTRTLKDVFDRFASADNYGFTKTHIPVALARYGDENLVSRSQAKRMLTRVDRFQEVLLDFSGVASIWQAFADEVFRVFKNQHTEVHIAVTRANEDVHRMIQRVQSEST